MSAEGLTPVRASDNLVAIAPLGFCRNCDSGFCDSELSSRRRAVIPTTAVIDGIIHDTYDPSRNGTRCVYAYFTKGTGAANVVLKDYALGVTSH
jgi:hypothetical protein